MAFIFFDTETTGLNPYEHDIIELGAIFINDDFVIDKKSYYHKRLLIQNKDTISEEALEINHYNEKEWEKSGLSALDGFNDFNSWLKEVSPSEKPTFIGTNCEFDKSFLYSNCDRFQIFPYVDNGWIDLIAIWKLYKSKKNLKHLGNSQEVISKHFDIVNPKAHAALQDAVVGAMCFSKLGKMMFA